MTTDRIPDECDHERETRRVRQVSEVVLSVLSSANRSEANPKLNKKGRGRPKKKVADSASIANGSLSWIVVETKIDSKCVVAVELWDVSEVLPSSLGDILHHCLNSFFGGELRSWWLIGCVAVLWSLWLARNALIFQDERMESSEVFFLVQLCSF
ncbi:hypothetical protein V6N13_059408 [Hibiscus sabdariffa]